jgi:hypothetical protein
MRRDIYLIGFCYLQFYPKGYAVPYDMDIRYTSAVLVFNPRREALLRQVRPDRLPKVRLWSLAHLV